MVIKRITMIKSKKLDKNKIKNKDNVRNEKIIWKWKRLHGQRETWGTKWRHWEQK